MNKKLEWYLIIFLVVLLVILSSCSPRKMFADKQSPHQTSKEYQAENTKDWEQTDADSVKEPITGVKNIPNIVEALTCMFSPDTCEAREQEKKMDR